MDSSQEAKKSYHLRWNNHLSNLRTLLEYLYNEQSFVDVTLSCSDGLIRAHKLVLSACSPYFDTIFRENPCKHPTVILRGISLREMQLIIEYMYVGAVDVPESELPALLEVASELHVKGLVQSSPSRDDDDDMDGDEDSGESPEHGDESPYVKDEGRISTNTPDSSAETRGYLPQKRDEGTNFMARVKYEQNLDAEELLCGILGMAQVKMEEDRQSGTGSADDARKEEPGEVSYEFDRKDNGYSHRTDIVCHLCNRDFISKQNLKRHMQTHTGLKPHRCDYCSLSFLRLSHLQRHERVHTGERPFSCSSCDKQFSRSDKLKQHIALQHSGMILPKMLKQRGRPRKFPLSLSIGTGCNSSADGGVTYESLMSMMKHSSGSLSVPTPSVSLINVSTSTEAGTPFQLSQGYAATSGISVAI